MKKYSDNTELKSEIRSMINMWGLKNLLSALIDVITERGNDEYMAKLRDNLITTLTDYENRYVVNGRDTSFDD
jgi:hypothetical protein